MFILNSKIRGNQGLLQSLLVFFFYLELKCNVLLNYGLLVLKNGATFCHKMPMQYILILCNVIFLRCRGRREEAKKLRRAFLK